MKALLILSSGWLQCLSLCAQTLPEIAYVRDIDSLVNSGIARASEFSLGSDCADQATAWYVGDRLIFVNAATEGESSQAIETNYYVRNDTLVYTSRQLCRTISPPPSRPEEQTENLNDEKRPESRTNCVSVSLFLESRRMLYTLDGENVFDDPRRLEQEEAELMICYSHLLNELRKTR